MKKLIIILAFLPSLAFAQEITLKLQPHELNIIGQGLDAQKVAVDSLIAKLRQQYIDQQPKQEAPKPAEPVQPPK